MADSDAEQAALRVLRQLRERGHVAYFAGGCVRDRLLGLTPKDYDVATDAPPQIVRSAFTRTQAVGQAFGVILVHDFGAPIEVATFRTDGDYHDGRRPVSVTFADAEHDAQRRDFTINGLFFDPLENRVIDYVGGRRDLAGRVLRAIGDPAKRFAEDHLRMLRAVRFAARFGLSIDPATAAAIQADAPMLARISGERIESELRRMLTPPSRTEAYALLWQLSLIDTVFAPLDSHAGDTLESARSLFLALDPQQPITPALAYLCAMIDFRWHRAQRRPDLLGNLSPGEVPKLVAVARAALKLSNDDAEAMADVARWTHKLLSTHAPGIALLKRFLARPHVTSARQLLGALDSIGVAGERVQALQPQFDALAAGEVAPPPLLTGDMLVAAGYRPGPAFKRVLDAVYDAQLEDRVPTSEEAMELGRSLFDR